MAYSPQVLARARQQLASRKADRESENRQRLQQVYQQLPQVRQIDLQLRQSMAKAAQSAFTQGIDARKVMDQIRQENLALQRQRQALVEEHFGPGYLDEIPVCEHCGGSGYVGSTMCTCLAELCRKEQLKQISLLHCGQASFSDFRLDYYPDKIDTRIAVSPRTLMERNFTLCRRFAADFGPDAGNLLFVGGTGLGKTFLSACIATQVAMSGFSVCYETAANLFSKLEKDRFNPDEQTAQAVRDFRQCDLLILDDLGTELPGSFVTAALYSLLNDRLLSGKSMIISTNLINQEIAQRYSPQIASRLQGNFRVLPFVGEDIRVRLNR